MEKLFNHGGEEEDATSGKRPFRKEKPYFEATSHGPKCSVFHPPDRRRGTKGENATQLFVTLMRPGWHVEFECLAQGARRFGWIFEKEGEEIR